MKFISSQSSIINNGATAIKGSQNSIIPDVYKSIRIMLKLLLSMLIVYTDLTAKGFQT
ncbi:predicted protein [Histoplasma mississippiense (nom. inval.)]|uniref:predicted protein n=1 Tax=Ajellomyces capsulatus (strain NAm1 / WU24) TaxID=2059318 RepID=UPI000157B9C0|nr:predicted protein [Histoplasma mississippiense (nom. inval.)]EDN03597.1 predicted protein [Histoplasma mississippiense (nom. inval.)]